MMEDRLQRVLAEFDIGAVNRNRRMSRILPVLHRVQGELGYLPPEAFPEIARSIGVPEARLWGVATSSPHFRFKPAGAHSITVCQGTACHVRGSGKLARNLSDKLGIEPGDTTEDLLFSIEKTGCSGSCALAPVVLIDGKVHGRMKWSRLSQVVDELRASAQERQPALIEEAAS